MVKCFVQLLYSLNEKSTLSLENSISNLIQNTSCNIIKKHICLFTFAQFRVILSRIMILFSLLLLHVLLTPCQSLPAQIFRIPLLTLDKEYQVTLALYDTKLA